MNTVKQALILAGGIGERLRPLTNNCPKPMVEVNGKPFLEYVLRMLKNQGIKEVVLLLGYLPDKISAYFGDGSKFGLQISYSVGAVNDETGTRIRNARKFVDDHFLLLYGDTYWQMELQRMSSFFFENEILLTNTVYTNHDGQGEYGFSNNMEVADDGRVLRYDTTRSHPRLNATDISYFIVSKDIFALMPEHNFSFQNVIFQPLIRQSQFYSFKTDTPYYYMTSPATLSRVEAYMQRFCI